MAIEINTKVSVGQTFGKQKIANLTLEDAKFFGRPNFSGEEDRFKDKRRKFTVLIPNEVADQLRDMGYNVKTTIPTQEQLQENPELEPISHLKVMVDDSSLIYIRMGDEQEKLDVKNFGVMDRARVETMDMEIRGWLYNQDEVDQGLEEPKFSARLVALVATIQLNILDQKYGRL
jgi:hypothetical protein